MLARAPARAAESAPAPAKVAPVGASQYLLCGALQFLSAFGYSYLIALVFIQGYKWISAGSGFVDIYCRAILASGAGFLGMCILPILAKWTLIGRWKPQQIRVWSLKYFRFWLVKTLVRLNPLVLFAGSPIFIFYLRALGAKIGRDVLILSPQVPVCTDLLTIGDNTVICKDSFFSCYSAHDGVIYTGPVAIGKNAFVGEMTVLEIGSSLGDGAQLGHSSSLHAGQSVPAGERRCGSPARQRTEVDYRQVDPAECGALRKIAYSAFVLLSGLRDLGVSLERRDHADPHDRRASALRCVWICGVFALDLLRRRPDHVLVAFRWLHTSRTPRCGHCCLVCSTSRSSRTRFIRYTASTTGSTEPLGDMSNVKFFIHLFGDSSYIVHYLRAIGYDLSQDVVQTGSNFGLSVKHDNPFLVSIGRGTMIADWLSVVNTDYSNTSFRVSRATIGPDNFLGNAVVYPSQGRTGANCLLATKVMVPVEGDVREGVGLLGSPSFEIPRSVQRDIELSRSEDGKERDRKLAAKNKHNLVTMGLFLLAQWFLSFLMVLLFFGAGIHYETVGVSMFALALVLAQFVSDRLPRAGGTCLDVIPSAPASAVFDL